MPRLVKVGHSSKDPELRAKELNHSGSPHPYIVEYEMLVNEPFQIEQKAHKFLSDEHEGKEWFRCLPEEAIAAIKQAAGNSQINEDYKKAQREKAEQIHRQQEIEAQQKREQGAKEREIEQKIRDEENAIMREYGQIIESIKGERMGTCMFGGAILLAFGLGGFSIASGTFSVMGLIGYAIAGLFLGMFLHECLWKLYFYKQTSAYKETLQERDKKLADIRSKYLFWERP